MYTENLEKCKDVDNITINYIFILYMKVSQEDFEEKLNLILDDAENKWINGEETIALALEEIVFRAAVERWNWELDDDMGVGRRTVGKGRMGHLLNKI